jgi:hypothetical protein
MPQLLGLWQLADSRDGAPYPYLILTSPPRYLDLILEKIFSFVAHRNRSITDNSGCARRDSLFNYSILESHYRLTVQISLTRPISD